MSVETTACESLPVIPKTSQGRAIEDEFLTGCDEVEIPEVTSPIPTNFPTVVQTQPHIITANLRVLLASILGTIDASIPNKDQNRAIKHIIRKQFDGAYLDIARKTYPDFEFDDEEYILEPESNRAKAFAQGIH